MTEKAIVCEINNASIKVIPEQDCDSITNAGETDSANCVSCAHCIGGENTVNRNKQSFTVLNKNNLPLRIGDLVEYYISPRAVILSAIGVFVLPFILFAIGYYTGISLFGAGNSLIPILCGLGGSVLGFLSMIVIKAIRRHQYLPEITKVILRNQSDK